MKQEYKYGDFAKIKPKKRIVVLYHNDCADGFSGAWAAWKKFGAQAEYFPAQHQVSPSPHLTNKEIYCIDFTFQGKNLENLILQNKKVVILDHHASVKKEIEKAHEFVFNNHKSGATIAWEYFHPKKKIPLFLRYIEDRDIWRFTLPYTREILSVVDLKDHSWSAWNKFANDLEKSKKREEYIKAGKVILDYQAHIIKRALNDAEIVRFHGKKAAAVNSAILKSEIGHAFYTTLAPIAIIWSERNNRIFVSLRSSRKLNVSKIAKKYGGGGHRGAAGFSLPSHNKFPWK